MTFISPLISQGDEKVKKEIGAIKLTEQTINIDGLLDDSAWESAPIATGFIQKDPNPGIPSSSRTEVKIMYDDNAVYVGAMLFDNHPDSILRELTARDNIGNADWFVVMFDFYRDGLNGVEYVVTASGVQQDTKFSANDNDSNWDAVWESKVSIIPEGWSVEMKIPYSAMRFPKAEEQIWHINFGRSVRRTREQSWWNEIDPAVSGWFNQFGLVKGIRNIEPPTRLFFFPYISGYLENYPVDGSGDWTRSINGGMDVKYGINDAFTLDMTLIPDFGQVQSDNQVLNLSPFEVQFNENRQFFTEGTELFNRAGIFYSRRIGGTPINYGAAYDNLSENEIVIENPEESQLINATKVSGRTLSGLGIGLFNAFTSTTYATIEDTVTLKKRDQQTDPFTNYNIFVLDQNLPNNSFVSVINTNVWRAGSAYEANVTAGEFSVRNKENSIEVEGGGGVSQLYYGDSTKLGHAYDIGLSKTNGKLNFGIDHELFNKDLDINDLGFYYRTNLADISIWIGYNEYEPGKVFNRWNVNYNAWYFWRVDPKTFTDFGMGENFFGLLKNWMAIGLSANQEPAVTYDYFGPRVDGRYYTYPTNYSFYPWISSDYRKKFAMDVNLSYRKFNQPGRQNIGVDISPRYRVNDKLSFTLSVSQSYNENGEDFADLINSPDSILYGKRNREIFNLVLSSKYSFNPNMGITFRLRHYWDKVDYSELGLLNEAGNIDYFSSDNSIDPTIYNGNFNAFNIDMVFKWRFAPGSEMSLVWKNEIIDFRDQLASDYFNNLDATLSADQRNNFSIKMLYFIDYLTLKKNKKS